MQIADGFKLKDVVSGLTIEVIPGKRLDRLHITFNGQRLTDNRDFWFDKDGAFDGTGSRVHRTVP